jgi:hypothetical protein
MATMKNILPVALIVVLLGVVAVAAISQFAFNNTGAVVKAEAKGYLEGTETLLTDIDWGLFTPGESKTEIIDVKNTGTVPAIINLEVISYTPTTAEGLVTLVWSLEADFLLALDGEVPATLTLTLLEETGAAELEPFTVVASITAEEEP